MASDLLIKAATTTSNSEKNQICPRDQCLVSSSASHQPEHAVLLMKAVRLCCITGLKRRRKSGLTGLILTAPTPHGPYKFLINAFANGVVEW